MYLKCMYVHYIAYGRSLSETLNSICIILNCANHLLAEFKSGNSLPFKLDIVRMSPFNCNIATLSLLNCNLTKFWWYFLFSNFLLAILSLWIITLRYFWTINHKHVITVISTKLQSFNSVPPVSHLKYNFKFHYKPAQMYDQFFVELKSRNSVLIGLFVTLRYFFIITSQYCLFSI
jgi:hypothetical protein